MCEKNVIIDAGVIEVSVLDSDGSRIEPTDKRFETACGCGTCLFNSPTGCTLLDENRTRKFAFSDTSIRPCLSDVVLSWRSTNS